MDDANQAVTDGVKWDPLRQTLSERLHTVCLGGEKQW